MPPDSTKPRLHLRGARSFLQGRFESAAREAFDDGWAPNEQPQSELKTEVTIERARSIVSHNDSPDVGFDRSINPYRGCEHGCIYCFARPTHSYLNLSPGLDFETRIIAKQRNGPVGTVKLTFLKSMTRFENLAPGSTGDY